MEMVKVVKLLKFTKKVNVCIVSLKAYIIFIALVLFRERRDVKSNGFVILNADFVFPFI